MPLLVYGINHQSAPISVRERLAFHSDNIPNALNALTAHAAVDEAVILSTCNRTEIYTQLNQYLSLQHWLQTHKQLQDLDITPYCYAHHEIDAVSHIMRVASGLDSMILGEPQVFGQLKTAYQTAKDIGAVGNTFQQLFPAIFNTGKHIRTNTPICAHPISLAYSITQLAKQQHHNLSECNVLLIGAGETIELVATHLSQQGVNTITIANRTLENAQRIAKPINAEAITTNNIASHLPTADIVVTGTSSPLPILSKSMVADAQHACDHQPLFLVDLAVPRDIAPDVNAVKNVSLYNIDDLEKIISENLNSKREAAKQAEEMITLQADHCFQKIRVHNARDIIRDFRTHIEALKDQELQKALDQLETGQDPHIVLTQFARNLVNKVMHQPTIKLRKAASEEQFETLKLAKTLFELE